MSNKRKKKIRRGKFYISYPSGGHPSLIFRKNKRKNMYDAIVFGTTPGHHRIVLSYPISLNIRVSVIHTRPIRGVRSDFGDKELAGLTIHKADKIKLEIVKRKKPEMTRKYKMYKNKKMRRAT